jgi:hypothetical protein
MSMLSMKQRYERHNLDTLLCYNVTRKSPTGLTEIYVGRFIRCYRMGSGDGMTSHWEFDNNGTIVRIDDETWGSVSGDELLGFSVTNAPVYEMVENSEYTRWSETK